MPSYRKMSAENSNRDPGVFVTEVMIELKTAPAMFQCIITEIFNEYIPTFMQVFLDDFTVYGQRLEHMT